MEELKSGVGIPRKLQISIILSLKARNDASSGALVNPLIEYDGAKRQKEFNMYSLLHLSHYHHSISFKGGRRREYDNP